ncbi:hypothetical protein WDW89_01590 [Deltaproteobacteria bacterium TL4]
MLIFTRNELGERLTGIGVKIKEIRFSSISSSIDIIHVSQDTPVTFTVKVQGEPNSVSLQEDISGELKMLVSLTDSGDLGNGDVSANDGLYTGIVNFSESSPRIIYLKAIATHQDVLNQTWKSNTYSIPVVDNTGGSARRESIRKMIKKDTGGTISFNDGVHLSVPARSLSEDTNISVIKNADNSEIIFHPQGLTFNSALNLDNSSH